MPRGSPGGCSNYHPSEAVANLLWLVDFLFISPCLKQVE